MGKHNKAKKQQNAVPEEDIEEEPVEEELDFEKEDSGETVEVKETVDDSEEFDFEKGDDSSEPPQIKKTTLILGLVFATLGLLGIAGLRSGIIQSFLGYTSSPGIGSQEMMGLIGSLAPLTIGLFMIGFWGVKNDPIYNEIEKVKKETESHDDDDVPENAEPEESEELEEEESEVIREEPRKAEAKPKEIEPEDEVVGEITQADIPDEFNESLAELEDELNGTIEEPREDPEALRKKAAEEELARIQRCEKMLSAIVVLPDDKNRLKGLIAKGSSIEEFSQEVKQAVQRRKKKEEEKDVTAEEKASILEDELVAELGELGDDGDDSSLEDQIIKELEDLDEL